MKYIEIGSNAQKHTALGVLIGSTITFAIMYSPQPLISLFSKQYHIAPETASLSISLTTIALAISLFFVSMFSNSWNRKKFICGSLLMTSCLSILTSFVSNFYIFLALRFFEGISIAGYPSIAMAYLNEEFSPKDIGTVIGYYVAGNSLGALIGRIIIGTLTDITNWHTAFMIQGLVSLVGSLWIYITFSESQNFVKKRFAKEQFIPNIKSTLFNIKLLSMYISGLLLMGSYVTILDYIGYPLTKPPYSLSQTVFGFIFLVNLFGIWSSILFGKLADNYSRKHVIGLAITIFIAGVMLTLNEHLVIKIIGLSGVAFGFTAANSVASSWIGLLASKDTKGQASSFYLLFYYVGSSLFGWLGGVILNHFGWNGIVCYVCSLLIAASLVSCRPWDALYKKILLLTN